MLKKELHQTPTQNEEFAGKIEVQPSREPKLEDLSQSELIERLKKAEHNGKYLADYTVNLQNEVIRLRNFEARTAELLQDIGVFDRAVKQLIKNFQTNEGDE